VQRRALPAQKNPARPRPISSVSAMNVIKGRLTIPVGSIDLVIGQDDHEHGSDEEDGPGEYDGLGSESSRGSIGDDTVGQWTSSEIEDDIEEPADSTRTPCVNGRWLRDTETSNSKLDQDGDTKTEDVDRSSTKSPHDEPSDQTCANLDRITDEGKSERVGGIEAGLLKEVGSTSGEGVPVEVHTRVCHDCDFGSSEIDTLEQFEVGSTRGVLSFHGVGILHESKSILDLFLGLVRAGESSKGDSGSVDSSSLDAPGR
jgi:hypothetical protein